MREQSDRWVLSASHPAPQILVSQVSGQLDLRAVKVLMDAFDRVARASSGPIDAFHDWQGITGYTSEARETYTKWASGHRSSVRSVNILVGSKMLAMGVNVANLALGYLHAYHNRSAFESARDQTIASRPR